MGAMGKKILGAIGILAALVFIFLNAYFNMKYDISLIDYFSKSQEITATERAWLSSQGKIIYGSDQSSPPLRYKDETDSQYKGLVVDAIRALSIEIGEDVSFEPSNWWMESMSSLEQEKTDIFDLIPSKERSEKFAFTDPLYQLRGNIFMTKSSEIDSYYDLKGKTVAVLDGDYAIEFLKNRVSDIKFIYTPDVLSAMQKVASGEADAAVGDEPVIVHFMNRHNMMWDYRLLDKPIYEEQVVLAVPKSKAMLVPILNKGIYSLKKKNMTEKIQQKWVGVTAFTKDTSSEKVILVTSFLISLLFLCIYLVYSWNRLLKSEVLKKTSELNQSRQRLQTTFDSITDYMVVLDSGMKVESVNRAFVDFTGMGEEQLIGKSFLDFDELTPKECLPLIEDTLRTSSKHTFEFQHENNIYSMSTFPLDWDEPDMESALVMVKDVTHMKLSEQKLLQDNKMLAIGQLASGVAHEIRNPLGIIRSHCYVLRHSQSVSEEEIQGSVAAIENSVVRASGIIENLLNFVRISSDKCQPANVRDFLESVIALERKTLEKNSIDVSVECPDDISCCLHQDSLKHVFINLISNSMDAIESGGRILIKSYTEGNYVIFEFSDNGSGISEKDIKSIFNPFFTTKPAGKGTGLGLYITYNEVKKCGGAITVSSKQGEGTTFRIEIPLREAKDEIRLELQNTNS